MASRFVTVEPVPSKQLSLKDMQSLLQSSALSVDRSNFLNLIGTLSGTAAFAVSCREAPSNCRAIGRLPCIRTAHTCGACMEPLIGEYGDSNSPCLPKTLSKRSLMQTRSDGMACAEFTDTSSPNSTTAASGCGQWHVCVSGKCVLSSKQCVHSCSRQGQCLFRVSHSRASVSVCPVTNSTCEAYCVCREGYTGSHCQLTSGEHAELQGKVALLLSSLLNATIDSAVEDNLELVVYQDILARLVDEPAAMDATSSTTALSLANR